MRSEIDSPLKTEEKTQVAGPWEVRRAWNKNRKYLRNHKNILTRFGRRREGRRSVFGDRSHPKGRTASRAFKGGEGVGPEKRRTILLQLSAESGLSGLKGGSSAEQG